MPYSIFDMGIDEEFDTYDEARERLMEEAYTYGNDFLEETYHSYFPWKDLWDWCIQQESFLDEFGDSIANAEQEFCDAWIMETESGTTVEYLKREYLRELEHAPSYLAGDGRQ